MKNITKFVYNKLTEFSQERKVDFLYHYTTLEAFTSIISSKEIRFSDCQYLNDSMELEYGLNKVREFLTKQLAKCSMLINKDLVEESLKNLYSRIDTLSINFPSFYIFCLCEESDLLSQWRGYSKDSCPIAIKFEINKLGILANIKNSFLFKVIYEEQKQNELLEEIVKQFIQNTLEKRLTKKSNLDYASNALFLSTIFLKHNGFKEEKEWRFMNIYFPGSVKARKTYFSPLKMFLLPYKAFTFNELFPNSNGEPIKEIIVGPQKNSLSFASLQKYVKSEQLNIQVSNSEIPFRI